MKKSKSRDDVKICCDTLSTFDLSTGVTYEADIFFDEDFPLDGFAECLLNYVECKLGKKAFHDLLVASL